MPEINTEGFEKTGLENLPVKGSEKLSSEESFSGDINKGIENPLAGMEDLEKIAQQQEKISQAVPTSNSNVQDDATKEHHLKVKNLAQELASIQDAEERIKKLVDLATEHDPITAISVAKDLDDNYVLDCLNDQLHEEHVQKILKEKGFIGEM